MRRTVLIALLAVAVVGVVCLAVVLVNSNTCKEITIQDVRTAPLAHGLTLSFDVTNNTAGSYALNPLKANQLEICRASHWEYYCTFEDYTRDTLVVLRPHQVGQFVYALPNIPVGSTLRLGIPVEKEVVGLAGLFLRLKSRFVTHQNISLNPFSKREPVFKSFQIISEGFTLPSAPASIEPKASATAKALK